MAGCTLCGLGGTLLFCDGKIGKEKCSGRHCFTCEGVTEPPVGKWFCNTCKAKRGALPATPSQPNAKRLETVSPELREKVKLALQKDTLPAFPGSSASASSSPPFGVSEAFQLVAGKLDSLDAKMSALVTADQLVAVKSDIVAQFEKHVAELRVAFAKLEQENQDLRARVDELEKRLNSLKSSSSTGPDVAFKRLSFIGLPLSEPEARLKFVKGWMSTNFPDFTFSVGNVFRGPVGKRVLTAVAYVEFSDNDTRNLVLQKLKSNQPACVFSGSTVVVKPALSQYVRERIWAVNTAYDLVKKHSAASGKEVTKTKGKDATVSVGGVVAFTQSGSASLGSFVGVFSDLSLPGK